MNAEWFEQNRMLCTVNKTKSFVNRILKTIEWNKTFCEQNKMILEINTQRKGVELFQCFYIYIIWILSSWMIIFLWISQMGTGLCLVRKEWWEICVLIELGALITTLYTDLYLAVGCNVESEPNLISSMFYTHCFCIWSESDLMCCLISQEDNEAYFLFMFTWMRAKLLKYGELRIFSQLNVVDLSTDQGCMLIMVRVLFFVLHTRFWYVHFVHWTDPKLVTHNPILWSFCGFALLVIFCFESVSALLVDICFQPVLIESFWSLKLVLQFLFPMKFSWSAIFFCCSYLCIKLLKHSSKCLFFYVHSFTVSNIIW